MKKGSILILFISLAAVLMTGCLSIPVGDDGSLKIGKDGISFQSGGDSNESLDIQVKDGEMIFTGVDEQGEGFTSKVSTDQKLPDAFPKDIPIPSDVELTVIESEISGTVQIMVQYTIEGTVGDYYNKYRQYVDASNYTTIIDVSNGNVAEDTVMENIVAKSDDHSLTIGIMKSGTGEFDRGNIVVSIMYMIEQK